MRDSRRENLLSRGSALESGTYGAPRVHAELTLVLGLVVNRKKAVRLLRVVGRQGIGARRKGRRLKPLPAVHEDLVQRRFSAAEPDRIWCTDVTEHPTAEGKVYFCAVLDVWSRMVVGWSIADHGAQRAGR